MRPDTDFSILLLYSIAAVSGALGGCTAASHHLLRGSKLRISFAVAYGVIGMTFSLLAMAYSVKFGMPSELETIISNGLLAGFIAPTVLAGANISARAVLRRLGIEVELTIKRTNQENKKTPGQDDV